jgi:hypothetical protein
MTVAKVVNRASKEMVLSVTPKDGLTNWLKKTDTLYLAIIIFFGYFVNYGIAKTTQFAIASVVLTAVLLYDEKLDFIRKLGPLKSEKRSTRKAKSADFSRTAPERAGISVDQCLFAVRRVRALATNESFVDFTDYPAAFPTSATTCKIVFCVEITYASSG